MPGVPLGTTTGVATASPGDSIVGVGVLDRLPPHDIEEDDMPDTTFIVGIPKTLPRAPGTPRTAGVAGGAARVPAAPAADPVLAAEVKPPCGPIAKEKGGVIRGLLFEGATILNMGLVRPFLPRKGQFSPAALKALSAEIVGVGCGDVNDMLELMPSAVAAPKAPAADISSA